MQGKKYDRVSRQIKPQLPIAVYEFLRDTFWSAHGGASYLLGAFTMLWDRRLEDLKNFFTQKELLLFVDALKNVDELPGHIPPGRFLIDTVRYKIEEERYAIKWGVDQQVVMRNLEWADTEPLTMVVLTVWAWAGTHGNHGKNRYDYVKELTS